MGKRESGQRLDGTRQYEIVIDNPSYPDPYQSGTVQTLLPPSIRVTDPTLKAIFQELYQHEVDHLHTLQERYHTHLNDDVLNLRPDADALLADALFEGVDLADPSAGPLGLYDKAILMERRTRDHFRDLAEGLPDGPEKDVCLELAAEEEEHVAMLETEREQFVEEKVP